MISMESFLQSSQRRVVDNTILYRPLTADEVDHTTPAVSAVNAASTPPSGIDATTTWNSRMVNPNDSNVPIHHYNSHANSNIDRGSVTQELHSYGNRVHNDHTANATTRKEQHMTSFVCVTFYLISSLCVQPLLLHVYSKSNSLIFFVMAHRFSVRFGLNLVNAILSYYILSSSSIMSYIVGTRNNMNQSQHYEDRLPGNGYVSSFWKQYKHSLIQLLFSPTATTVNNRTNLLKDQYTNGQMKSYLLLIAPVPVMLLILNIVQQIARSVSHWHFMLLLHDEVVVRMLGTIYIIHLLATGNGCMMMMIPRYVYRILIKTNTSYTTPTQTGTIDSNRTELLTMICTSIDIINNYLVTSNKYIWGCVLIVLLGTVIPSNGTNSYDPFSMGHLKVTGYIGLFLVGLLPAFLAAFGVIYTRDVLLLHLQPQPPPRHEDEQQQQQQPASTNIPTTMNGCLWTFILYESVLNMVLLIPPIVFFEILKHEDHSSGFNAINAKAHLSVTDGLALLFILLLQSFLTVINMTLLKGISPLSYWICLGSREDITILLSRFFYSAKGNSQSAIHFINTTYSITGCWVTLVGSVLYAYCASEIMSSSNSTTRDTSTSLLSSSSLFLYEQIPISTTGPTSTIPNNTSTMMMTAIPGGLSQQGIRSLSLDDDATTTTIVFTRDENMDNQSHRQQQQQQPLSNNEEDGQSLEMFQINDSEN